MAGIVSFRVIKILCVYSVLILARDAQVQWDVQVVQLRPRDNMMLGPNYVNVKMDFMMI